MSLRRLAALSQRLVPPGSHVRHAFICQAAPNVWFFVINYLTYLTIFWIKYRVVCVTDEAIYVFRGTKFSVEPRETARHASSIDPIGPGLRALGKDRTDG